MISILEILSLEFLFFLFDGCAAAAVGRVFFVVVLSYFAE